MSNIKLGLYRDNDLILDSQLRSVLLFEDFGKASDQEQYINQRAVLSIAVQQKGHCKINDIKDILTQKCGMCLTNKEIVRLIKALEHEKLVRFEDDKVIAITESNEGEEYFQKLNDDTDNLINGVYKRFIVLNGEPPIHKGCLIKENIRRALSVYYKMAGLKFFKLQKENVNAYQAVETAIEKLTVEEGKRLVAAIGDTLQNPTLYESTILEKWARAFVVSQLIQLDPTMTSFKQDRLRSKSFVLDTDVLLYALTTHCKRSTEYRVMLNYLRDLGCDIYVPKEVITEINGHAQQAIDIVEKIGEKQIVELDESVLSSAKLNNVFVEDFVNRVKSEDDAKNMRFASYIGNIYNAKHDDVLLSCIGRIIGIINLTNELPHVDIDEDVMTRLSDLILAKTADTPKGAHRSDSFNEKVATDDTKLYLTISDCNKKAKINNLLGSSKLLPEKFYFLTQSTKIERSARELDIYEQDIICHPEALTSAIRDLGEIRKEDAEIINLFDNPFLSFIAEDIWPKINPLIEQGYYIYHEDTIQLKVKVNEKFDDLLTAKSNDEIVELSRKYEKLGFRFPKTVTDIADNMTKVVAENKKKDETIAEKEKEIAKLRKQLGKKRYLARIKNQNKKVSMKKKTPIGK